ERWGIAPPIERSKAAIAVFRRVSHSWVHCSCSSARALSSIWECARATRYSSSMSRWGVVIATLTPQDRVDPIVEVDQAVHNRPLSTYDTLEHGSHCRCD